MNIHTSRFGVLDIDDARIITFARGLPGFPAHRRFAMISTTFDQVFLWLQCVDDPALAFVITSPELFVPAYAAPGPADAEVFVICNRYGDILTGNFMGPLVIDHKTMTGEQVIVPTGGWTTRQPLVRLEALAA